LPPIPSGLVDLFFGHADPNWGIGAERGRQSPVSGVDTDFYLSVCR